jgi:hypothetical protein
MGKKPLTGVIGFLGVGVFLTGCNCCKQDHKQPFMNDRADSSLGVTKNMAPGWNNKAQNSTVNNAGSFGNSYGSTAGPTSGRGLDSAGGSNTLGGGMSSGMGGAPSMPSGGIQTSSSSPSIPGTSMANPPGGGSGLNDSTASLTSLPNSGSANASTSSGNIVTTSNHLSDSTSVKTADYKTLYSVDDGVKHAAGAMDDTGHDVVPTPPMTSLTGSSSGTTKKASPYPPAPPQTTDAPASMGTDATLNTPPPTVSAPTAPTIPASSAKPSPASSLPAYLNQ